MTAGELGLDPSSPTGVWMQFLIDSYDNGGSHPRRGRAGAGRANRASHTRPWQSVSRYPQSVSPGRALKPLIVTLTNPLVRHLRSIPL